MNLIPGIGTRGLYTLDAPFAAQQLPSTVYNCVAIRKLEDITLAGGDPKADYYTKNAIDASYEADLAAGVCIVTLQAASGSVIYVPSSFIASMPDQGGVPYRTLLLGVSLGALPDTQDLTYLKTTIAGLVHDNIGVTPEIQEVQISAATNLSQAEHTALEAARQANISNTTTDYARLLAAQAALAAANTKIQQLETYILSLPH